MSAQLEEAHADLVELTRLYGEVEALAQHRAIQIEQERQKANEMFALAVEKLLGLDKPSVIPRPLRTKLLARRLRTAALIDEENYLQEHSDVAEAKIDPVEHYIRHGIAECRVVALDNPRENDQ